MSALREAANKMLKMLEEASLADPALAAEIIYKIGAALPSLRAALAQEQAEPKPMHPELRKMWEEHFDRCFRAMPLPAQEQAEPLNLSDRAVQKRLAAQWGYVPTEQAEPVQEHEDWCASVTQLLLSYPPQKAPCNCKPAQKFKPTPLTQEQMDAPLKAEPAQEPVAWVECDGELVWNNREAAIGRNLYTTAPRRTMVPLTEGEIERIAMTHQSLRQVARAVEKASWEKNHG